MVCLAMFCAVSSMIVWSSVAGYDMLDCNRQLSTFRVSNTDVNGRTCADEIDPHTGKRESRIVNGRRIILLTDIVLTFTVGRTHGLG